MIRDYRDMVPSKVRVKVFQTFYDSEGFFLCRVVVFLVW